MKSSNKAFSIRIWRRETDMCVCVCVCVCVCQRSCDCRREGWRQERRTRTINPENIPDHWTFRAWLRTSQL